ncbi:MAG: 4Fe-4S binding protein [Planctomycetes bacterium]|nr:4Fe-4S binding protein [Planctomycetota bacterium]
MKRLNSTGQFNNLQKHLLAQKNPTIPTMVIPAGTCGQASGANDLIAAAEKEILLCGLDKNIRVRVTGCHGFCEMEPSVLIEPDNTFYPQVKPDDIPRLIKAVLDGKILEDLLLVSEEGKKYYHQNDLPFYQTQVRSILAAHEKIDPLSIANYIENDGYSAIAEVLENGAPEAILAEVKNSNLRGRGGAGFPTGKKWEMLANQSNGSGKYLICNADEGDPGAYMDRSVLEGNPHSIIEGMLLGAYATGATAGVIYVRKEYPLAIKHLELALTQAAEYGLLGDDILGKGFSFNLSLAKGAGAFVCGEETALIRSIEGKMGEPRQRPPFPITKGLYRKPTAINNVETWANIPIIIRQGAKKFTGVGTRNNSGTKIFSLVGKIKNTGLVEVPMGITLKEIIYGIGGGPSAKAKIKAVQTGGPSGGCIPTARFDLAIDYDSLVDAGSIMGSGGMIVMDEHTCMVDVAKYFMAFLKDESCGKCFTCRKGTQRMYELLEDISQGKGTLKHLELLKELAEVVKDTTMCGLGQTASNPVLSTLRYFRDEYLAHIEKQQCPAGVCKALITYSINENCTGCGMCVSVCSEEAISGLRKQRYKIDSDKCIKCGTCKGVCKFEAIEVS